MQRIFCIVLMSVSVAAGQGDLKNDAAQKAEKQMAFLQVRFLDRNFLLSKMDFSSQYKDAIRGLETFISAQDIPFIPQAIQRKKDATRVAQLWLLFIDKVESVFKRLVSYRTFKTKDKVDLIDLNETKLTRSRIDELKRLVQPIASEAVQDELARIMQRSRARQATCHDSSLCNKQYEQLQVLVDTLLQAITVLNQKLDYLAQYVMY